MDKINEKIIQCLKKEGESNQARLMTYSFAREGQRVFRRRLIDLKEKKIINIKKTKHEWNISLSVHS